MRLIVSSLTLRKAKALPVGTKKKWADGVYVKGNDHKWHKDKAHELAAAKAKEEKRHGDHEYVDDLKEAVTSYAEFLHQQDLHPSSSHLSGEEEHWTEFFDGDEWKHDDRYLKYIKKVKALVTKFHAHLVSEGKKEIAEDKKYEAQQKKNEIKQKQEKKKAEKQVQARPTVKFRNEIHAAKAASLVEQRGKTHEFGLKYLDGKTITDSGLARMAIGFTAEVNGVKGVITNFYTLKQRTGYRQRRTELGIPTLVMLTEYGEQKVQNIGPVKLLADPMKAKSSIEISGSLKSAGITEIIFDSDISMGTRQLWKDKLKDAFKDFDDSLDISFKDKIKIHIYGSKGPKRGALADYSSKEKVIRLSVAKTGSSEALAHELGHALDDKMNDWFGTGSYEINEIVKAYRQTTQGKAESERLSKEKERGSAYAIFGGRRRVSNYTSWMNKPEEVFARCFETYVAYKVPSWEKLGWAKKAVDKEAYDAVKPLFDKLLKDDKVRKAILVIVSGRR